MEANQSNTSVIDLNGSNIYNVGDLIRLDAGLYRTLVVSSSIDNLLISSCFQYYFDSFVIIISITRAHMYILRPKDMGWTRIEWV